MAAMAKLAGLAIPLFELVFARSVVVAVLAGWDVHRRRMDWRGRERGLLVLRGFFGFAALTCFYYAVLRMPLADATVIHFMNPVFTALAAAVVLGEHIGMVELGLTLLSLLGVVIVARPSFLFGASALDPVAVSVGLLGSVLAGGAYVMVRRLRNEDAGVVVLYFAVVSIILSAGFVVADPVVPTGWTWLVLVGLGVSTHFGQVFLTRGFQLERAARASSVGYLQIVFASIWGWAIFQESPDLWTWVGAAVVVGSTLTLVRLHPTR